MKLKNNALQELYDTLVSSIGTVSPYVDSPVDKAFRECDEKLSESITFEQLENLQDLDTLKKANGVLASTNAELTATVTTMKENDKKHSEKVAIMRRSLVRVVVERDDLKKKNCQLERDRDFYFNKYQELKKDYYFLSSVQHAGKERLMKANADRKSLQENLDYYMNVYGNELAEQSKQIEELKKELKETKERLDKANSDRTELQKNRDSYHDLYTELSKTYDKLSEEKRKLNARTDCLREEVKWYRKHYKEQYDKIQELNHRLLSIPVNATAFNQGQTDLWDMLQNVNDINVEEFDVECHSTNDVISMDLEDFLDCYKKWQEKKEKERLDHMRDYLGKFCIGRLCSGCPLGSDEYECGCGYSFMKFANDDQKIISDEELERYYEKVKPDDPCIGVREKIKEACDAFYDGIKAGLASEVKEVPVSCDIPIKDLASWECTIEATVEVNKDLLEKVCGVKPKEEEHKLEYGDAVRLCWRDYDYMYIGPVSKHIRLFNPKTHTVVCVSPTENLTYQGCKIVICDEDDLRKIWKDEK